MTEKAQYRDTFHSTYSDMKEHNGRPFRVSEIITEPDDRHDAETLPMYVIVFTDGKETYPGAIEAWPEEVLVAGSDVTDPTTIPAPAETR